MAARKPSSSVSSRSRRQPVNFTASDPVLASFAPVVASDTRVLILGSLPGAASLAASQYYGHPRNNFWRLVGEVIGVDLVAMDYETRLSTVLAHQIGLWDVIANARRTGSLDSEIRDHTQNDLLTLIDTLPALKTIAFNGGTAAKIGLKALGERAGEYRIISLPSSSPAHASLSYDQKLTSWQALNA
ncbi:DNA-deoxyinosine glycosylase [Herbaspirillum sp. alder98]|uniref:DNA-deoxyinosine glycosylase n=1 Tax=Herbaspirillum sp. alder98 TaxID=2913096 RepID=UPI001CD912DD|nr:DNA-deoxyinosine glycosylase [Herbaspirillum sp. alder98]MCA1322852.1 DNA-deoxyinosine glycosylase [Herbaspirillum sp. alder98]